MVWGANGRPQREDNKSIRIFSPFRAPIFPFCPACRQGCAGRVAGFTLPTGQACSPATGGEGRGCGRWGGRHPNPDAAQAPRPSARMGNGALAMGFARGNGARPKGHEQGARWRDGGSGARVGDAGLPGRPWRGSCSASWLPPGAAYPSALHCLIVVLAIDGEVQYAVFFRIFHLIFARQPA